MKLLILNQNLEAEPAPEIRDIECFRKIIVRDRDKYKKTVKIIDSVVLFINFFLIR